MNPQRACLLASLGFTFLSFLFAPAYMAHLRHRLERNLPEEWAKVTNNGPFTYVSPLLVSTRNHEEGVYATKLRQIALHGFPYDPHTGDRSIRSWFFDCMLFYPLAPFLLPAQGDVQKAWILAHATFGALWVLLFYLLIFAYIRDPRISLVLALAGFFFLDLWMWAGFVVLPAVFTPKSLPNLLFLLVSRACGPIHFMRLPTPCMTYLWLYASMGLCLKLGLAATRRPFASVFLGFSLGTLCLAHFYEWTFGVLSLLLFLVAGWRVGMPRTGRWNLGLASLLAVLISTAYYFLARHLAQDVMVDIIHRVGNPAPEIQWKSLLYLLLSLLFWRQASVRSGFRRWVWFLGWAHATAAFAINNLYLVLGYDLQFAHVGTLAALSSVLLFLCWLAEGPKLAPWLRVHALVLAAGIGAWVLLREKSWGDTHYKIFGTPRDVEAAARWINRELPPDSMMVSLSGALIEFLPLKIQMRYPVSNGVPNFGSPIPTERNLMGLARILKTLDVEPEMFFEQRWRHFKENDGKKQRNTHLTRDLDWESTRKAAWAYFLVSLEAYSDFLTGKEESRILDLLREAAPLERPFYLWLHKDDAALLRRPPEQLGGRLLYQNPSLRLYAFG